MLSTQLPETFKKKLASIAQRLIDERGGNLNQLARDLGYKSNSSLYSWLDGKIRREPEVRTLSNLAELLDWELEDLKQYLWSEEESEQPSSLEERYQQIVQAAQHLPRKLQGELVKTIADSLVSND